MSGEGIGLMTSFMNNAQSQQNAAISYRRQKELMNTQNKMNLANLKSAPSLEVEGLRMAGFNPAMVAGAGTMSAPSVSQGNADMPQTIPYNAQDSLMAAQERNIEAQTAKTREEERGVKQQNDIVDTANDSAVQGYLAAWNREQEDLEKARQGMDPDSEQYNKITARIKQLESMKTKVTDPEYAGALGIVQGTKAAADNSRENLRILGEYLKGALENSVAQKKLGNGTVDALASMPKLTKEKLAADIDHVRQLIAESESKEELNDETIEKLKKEIENIGDQILRAHLNDPNYIKRYFGEDSEEWKNYTDTQWRNKAFEVGGKIIEGAAFGSGVGLINKALNSVPKNSHADGYDWNGSGFEDGNIVPKNYHWSPDNEHGIGDKPQGVSQFEWNQMQKRAEQAGKKRR